VSKSDRKSQAVFLCADCGHVADADTNAAINIRKAGTRPSDANRAVWPVVRDPLMAAQQLHLKNLRPSGRGRL
jgi:putative transposase